MKLCNLASHKSGNGSLPVRGAWVEISISESAASRAKSLPVRGAWVEILNAVLAGNYLSGRSPCGERGLKYHYICDLGPTLEVAPRAGSVG